VVRAQGASARGAVPPGSAARWGATTRAAAARTLESWRLLLIVGTSLVAFSGFSFARAAARFGVPIAIINRGITRADELCTLKLRGNVGEILNGLVSSRSDL